jgi:hypothetical protein
VLKMPGSQKGAGGACRSAWIIRGGTSSATAFRQIGAKW